MNVQQNQIQQIGPDQYAQAQADMQRAKRLQSLADTIGKTQYGATNADVVAALVNGYTRAKALKQADETWSDAYKRASEYENQEKEAQRAREEQLRQQKLAEAEQAWRDRQDYIGKQSATQVDSERKYNRSVAAENRMYNEEQAKLAHQRNLELAAAKAAQSKAPKPLTVSERQKLAEAKAGLASMEQTLNQFEDMLYTTDKNGNRSINPDFAGGVGVIDQWTAPIGAMFGTSEGMANKKASRAATAMILQAASSLKGSLSDRDVALLERSAPDDSDSEDIWLDWYEKEFKPMIVSRAQALASGVQPYMEQEAVGGEYVPAPQGQPSVGTVFQSGKYEIEVR